MTPAQKRALAMIHEEGYRGTLVEWGGKTKRIDGELHVNARTLYALQDLGLVNLYPPNTYVITRA